MYIPKHFAQTDPAVLFDFMRQHSFGMLCTLHEGEPFVSHLPFLLRTPEGETTRLDGHMARANPQWCDANGQEVLVVFPGPHVYVSPSWYEADNVVPTWNYVAVHAYGTFEVVENHDELLAIVRDMVNRYEGAQPQPWQFQTESDYARGMLRQIVGFRIRINRLEGKWKLNQNHSEERRRKVVTVLEQRGDDDSRAIAALMQEELNSSGLDNRLVDR
jgi:transcriptional regulator